MSDAKIALSDFVAGGERFGPIGQDDFADFQDVGVVRRIERHMGVLLDQQDRRPGGVDLANDAEDRLRDLRSESQHPDGISY